MADHANNAPFEAQLHLICTWENMHVCCAAKEGRNTDLKPSLASPQGLGSMDIPSSSSSS